MLRNSTKQLTINLIANIVSYSTNIIISFFLTPYLIQVLGKETYSFYPMANNFVTYMSIITVALNSMASRFITIEVSKNNTYKANVYFSSVFYSNIIMSLVLLIPMIVIVAFLDTILNIPVELIYTVKILFALVFISMLINIVTSVFSVAVFAKNRIDLRSIGDIFQSVLKVGLYLILFFCFKPTIIYVGVVSVILSITYFSIHAFYTKKLMPEMKISFAYFDITAIKEILSSGVWNSFYQIGSSLMFSLAILYCNVFVSPAAGGEYSIIQTIPNFINGIISMLSAVFLPVITQTYATKSINDVIYEIKKSQKIMGMITNIPIAVFLAVGVEFYQLWVPGENSFRLYILSVLTILHLIIIGVTWPLSNLNTVLNKVKMPSLYMIFSGVINFVMVLFLTQKTNLGIYAIPLASCFILLIWAGIFIPIYPCKVLNISKKTFYPAIIKALISSMVIFLFTYIIKIYIIINSWLSLLVICFIAGVFGLLVNFILIFTNEEKRIFIKRINAMR